jgi:hypothetical protein
MRESDTDLILDHEESMKQQWYIKNSQYLQRVVGKGFEEFTGQINRLIQTYKENQVCQETIPEILQFKSACLKTTLYHTDNLFSPHHQDPGQNSLPLLPSLKTMLTWLE